MKVDMRKNPYQKHWWDERMVKLVIYITRNEFVWIGIGVIFVILYFKFFPNLDWVFGKRG